MSGISEDELHQPTKQQSTIEGFLGVNSFPTYCFIERNGRKTFSFHILLRFLALISISLLYLCTK